MRKRDHWRDPAVAGEYDARRFGGALQRKKHRRDEVLLLRLLARYGAGGERPVLDAPCGTGRFRTALETAGLRVVGADVSVEMISVGAFAGSGRCVRASAFRLPFEDRAFSGALCVRFLFHLDDGGERVAVWRELGRVTDGPVIGHVRFRGTWKHAGRWARSRVGLASRYRPSHGRAELEREVRDAGLELVELVPVSRAFSDKAYVVARRSR